MELIEPTLILLIRYVKMFREIYLRKVYERGMFK